MPQTDGYMCRCPRQGDEERGRQEEKRMLHSSPCLLVSMSPCLRCLLICATMVTTGCPRKQSSTLSAAPRASVALRVLVVNEPGVAEAINRLRGEWAERSGGEVNATSTTWADVSKADTLDADTIVFPSRYLGELCVRGWVQPVRSGVLESDEFNASDVFPLVRRDLITWGGEVMALPLGADLLTQSKSIESRPGIALLVQSAPAAITNEREGTLFDPQTMKPRITEAAYIRALQKLVDSSQQHMSADVDIPPAVPLLGWDDRLVAVTSASRNAASAFKLIAWLASAEISTQLSRSGEPLMPVRQSLVSSADWHVPEVTVSDRSTVAKSLEAQLGGELCFVIPRIPGEDEYIAALDDAVKAALSHKESSQNALQQAAQRWEQITNAHGREQQKQAYWKHLGIADH
jgi:hypothetical protein